MPQRYHRQWKRVRQRHGGQPPAPLTSRQAGVFPDISAEILERTAAPLAVGGDGREREVARGVADRKDQGRCILVGLDSGEVFHEQIL